MVRPESAFISLQRGRAELPNTITGKLLKGTKRVGGKKITQCSFRACSIHPSSEKILKCQELIKPVIS